MNVYLPELDATVDLSAEDLGYPKVVRDYSGLTFSLTREFDGDWGASLSYTNSESVGNYEGTVKSDNGQDDAGITQDFDQPGLTDGSYGYRCRQGQSRGENFLLRPAPNPNPKQEGHSPITSSSLADVFKP